MPSTRPPWDHAEALTVALILLWGVSKQVFLGEGMPPVFLAVSCAFSLAIDFTNTQRWKVEMLRDRVGELDGVSSTLVAATLLAKGLGAAGAQGEVAGALELFGFALLFLRAMGVQRERSLLARDALLYCVVGSCIVLSRREVWTAGAAAFVVLSACGTLTLLLLSPTSFSLGEAAAVSALFAGSQTRLLLLPPFPLPAHLVRAAPIDASVALALVDIGLCAVVLSCLCIAALRRRRRAPPGAAFAAALAGLAAMLASMSRALGRNALQWLLSSVRGGLYVRVLSYWGALVLAGVPGVAVLGRAALRSTTVVRKLYHLLALALFAPPLAFKEWRSGEHPLRSFLSLSVGAALCLFLVVEALRLARAAPLDALVGRLYAPVLDARNDDAKGLVVSHMYLLLAAAMPMWVFAATGGVALRATSALGAVALPYCGMIVVGVGDTAAAVVGRLCGRNAWAVGGGRGRRTLEGTAAFVASCAAAVCVVAYSEVGWTFGALPRSPFVYLDIVLLGLFEAMTSSIDNLVLPLMAMALLAA